MPIQPPAPYPVAPAVAPAGAPVQGPRTGGAWFGLLLLAYGAGSVLFAALGAVPAVLVPRLAEMSRLELELRLSEGGGSRVLSELSAEIFALFEALLSGALIDAGVTAGLGIGLMVAAVGVCWRSEAWRRIAVAVTVLKGLSLAGLAWYLFAVWVPTFSEMMELVSELAELVANQSGGRVRNPFAVFGSTTALQVSATVYLGSVLVPFLLALWIVLSRTVREWCGPASSPSRLPE